MEITVPVMFRIWDYDVLSSDDVVGVVLIDLSPLLVCEHTNELTGWLPIFDSLRGYCGDLYVVLKVTVISDMNPLLEVGGGVICSGSAVPPRGRVVTAVLGLAQDLVVVDDPEHHWREPLRTPRVSNYVRQRLVLCSLARARRQLSHKAVEMGGNAILSCNQCVDFLGEFGVVVRMTGTVVSLRRCTMDSVSMAVRMRKMPPMHRSITLTHHDSAGPSSWDPSHSSPSASLSRSPSYAKTHSSTLQETDVLEGPAGVSIITMDRTLRLGGTGILYTGGFVLARSVHLLTEFRKGGPDEATRRLNGWFVELAEELKLQAHSMQCGWVLSYRENIGNYGDLLLVSVEGTAVAVHPLAIPASYATFAYNEALHHKDGGWSEEKEKEKDPLHQQMQISPLTPPSKGVSPQQQLPQQPGRGAAQFARKLRDKKRFHYGRFQWCSICHAPPKAAAGGASEEGYSRCQHCEKSFSCPLIVSSLAVPAKLRMLGKGTALNATVTRSMKKLSGEANAVQVSEILPFLEYELHRQLSLKMRVLGSNCCFGLRTQIEVGQNFVIISASGDAVCAACIPLPKPLLIERSLDVVDTEDVELVIMQQSLEKYSQSTLKSREQCTPTKAFPFSRDDYNSSSIHAGPKDPTLVESLSDSESSDSDSTPSCDSNDIPPSSPLMLPHNRGGGAHIPQDLSLHALEDDGGVQAEEAQGLEDELARLVQVDDELDEDILKLLLPFDLIPINASSFPLDPSARNADETDSTMLVTGLMRVSLQSIPTHRLNTSIHQAYQQLLRALALRFQQCPQASVVGFRTSVHPTEDNSVETRIVATVQIPKAAPVHLGMLDEVDDVNVHHHEEKGDGDHSRMRKFVVTSGSQVRGHFRPEKFLTAMNVVVVRETWNLRDQTIASGFVNALLAEAIGILRTQAIALGANSVINTEWTTCNFIYAHRSDVYAIGVLKGDAVIFGE